MKNKNLAFAIVAAVVVIGFVAYSFSGDQNTTKSESIQESLVNGTATESITKRETTTSDDGSQVIETNTKTTVDPEGLMNKKTMESTTEIENTP